mmetsp:Transcript_51122/g.110952  ORF Transcript_51122/g.110952 Transcript_51122/m.110952 type:complete len:255 (-) Transcript_51122:34-798(-)
MHAADGHGHDPPEDLQSLKDHVGASSSTSCQGAASHWTSIDASPGVRSSNGSALAGDDPGGEASPVLGQPLWEATRAAWRRCSEQGNDRAFATMDPYVALSEADLLGLERCLSDTGGPPYTPLRRGLPLGQVVRCAVRLWSSSDSKITMASVGRWIPAALWDPLVGALSQVGLTDASCGVDCHKEARSTGSSKVRTALRMRGGMVASGSMPADVRQGRRDDSDEVVTLERSPKPPEPPLSPNVSPSGLVVSGTA